MENENAVNKKDVIIAHCGLVCTRCGMFLKGRCQGCHSERPMNRNCKMKECSLSRGYSTCAECTDFKVLKDCKKLNNIVSKFFEFIFRTDRFGNLETIREIGLEEFRERNR